MYQFSAIRPLFDKAASEALKLAEDMWGYSKNPVIAKSEGGIRIAIWELDDMGVAPGENEASSND